jgi:hypothetical protein
MRDDSASNTHHTRHAIGGAMVFVLASRMIGLLREAAIVAVVGVHDFTDAYFALSPFVLWFQNWSFGALTLYLVPRFLAVEPSARRSWLAGRVRAMTLFGIAGGIAFALAASWIESALLDGRRALGTGGVLALSACIPLCAANGVLYGAITSSTRGILFAARSQVVSNIAGVGVLGAAWLDLIPLSLALPLSLLSAQATLTIALRSLVLRATVPMTTSTSQRVDSSQVEFAATTAENAAFNANIIAQQALIGRLQSGSITLNGYVTRLILFPIAGLLQPLQQRLLITFSSHSVADTAGRATFIARAAVALSAVFGMMLGALCYLSHPVWPQPLRSLASAAEVSALVTAYACYAGIMFANQSYARLFFSQGIGWRYTCVMVVAYSVGAAGKFLFVPSLGLIAVPATSALAEGCALLACGYVLTRSRPQSLRLSVTP